MSTLLTYIAQSHHIRPLRVVRFPDAFIQLVRSQKGACSPYRCVTCPLFTARRACVAICMNPTGVLDVNHQRLRLLNIAERMQRYFL